MKKEVKFGKYIIRQNDNGSFEVYDKSLCSNTKEALREIAKKSRFEYNENWNTQQLGRKIISDIDPMRILNLRLKGKSRLHIILNTMI